MRTTPPRFALLDDHPTVVAGVEQFISSSSGAEVIWRGGNPGELEPLLANVDYLISDLLLGVSDAFPFLQRVRKRYARVRVIVLSMRLDLAAIHHALRLGVHGYVAKADSPEEILKAVELGAEGAPYLSPAIREVLGTQASGEEMMVLGVLETLTARERQIFSLLATEAGNIKLAQILRLSVKTVETHKEHLKNKFTLQNMEQLRDLARQYSWRLDLPVRASTDSTG